MEDVKEILGKPEENMYCLDWFLCLKKESKE
jgi:peroxiredoxin (alkyl hydroperoxide reductase subunit C)